MEPNEIIDFYTVKEFAKLLKVTPETIRKAIRAKKLIALKPGGGRTSSLRIHRTEIERMAQRQMYTEE